MAPWAASFLFDSIKFASETYHLLTRISFMCPQGFLIHLIPKVLPLVDPCRFNMQPVLQVSIWCVFLRCVQRGSVRVFCMCVVCIDIVWIVPLLRIQAKLLHRIGCHAREELRRLT